MPTRRTFALTGLAAAAMPGLARAQSYQVPGSQIPRVMRIGNDWGPGEVHVDPGGFSLYWTLGEGRAIRYAVGIGRGDLYESGRFFCGAKKEWPSWTPTDEMIEREPESYAQWEDGMPGGPDNPLGARALYLFTEEKGDTFLRIHGTPNPSTVGSAVSNGCVRLVNSHIVDLYGRVPIGAPIILH